MEELVKAVQAGDTLIAMLLGFIGTLIFLERALSFFFKFKSQSPAVNNEVLREMLKELRDTNRGITNVHQALEVMNHNYEKSADKADDDLDKIKTMLVRLGGNSGG